MFGGEGGCGDVVVMFGGGGGCGDDVVIFGGGVVMVVVMMW
jgi:hypothetical protein